MWESGGIHETHPEFAGRVVEYATEDLKHANAVAAVMLGAGITNTAQGAAPAAILHAYEQPENALVELTSVATNGLIRFSNHSYRTMTDGPGVYTPNDGYRDQIVYTAYYHLPVWAAGNEGTSSIGVRYNQLAGGYAKNVLCVGAVEELTNGYAGASSVVMTSYSSWGPTDDGRIKPDLVASGFPGSIPEQTESRYFYVYDEGYYGTSFAAPSVTGSLGLLQELHERLSGSNVVPLLASSYKGLVIHTADEAGDAPGPDYAFGWGLMNTHSAAQLMAENARWNSSPFIKEIMLPDGEEAFFPVEADTNLPLRITICWSDPPGAMLQNDIDLRIIDPSGQTNFPWVLNLNTTNWTESVTKGDNTVDNVEQVEITNPAAGAYSVLINHKGTLMDGGQDVSIIISGIIPDNIDSYIAFSINTNGFPQIQIPNIIGSIYEISYGASLPHSSQWDEAPESPLSILQLDTQWIDPAGSTNPVRFYKIYKTR
jgi:hypothetical protein